MKKALFGMMAFVAMAIVGCSNEPVEQDVPMGETATSFYATVESQEDESDTRTALGTDNVITWNAGDAITIFKSNGRIQEYVTANGGTTDVKFDYKSQVAQGEALSANYAVYPHGIATGFEGATETFTVDMSGLATQTYTENTFAPGAAVMVSKSTSENLFFKNAMSFVRCQLKGSVPGDYVVTSVKISSASKALSGTATIAMSDCIAVMAADGGKSVEVVAANGVVLEDVYTDVYLTIPAGTYTDLTYTITGYKNNVDKTPVVFSANFSTTFNRNKIKTLRKTFNSDSWNGSTSEDKIWDGESVTAPAVEDGVMNINTPAEMAWLGKKEKFVSADGVNTININGSFDMNGMEFTTLSAHYITLAINGNNNTISNLTFKAPVDSNGNIGHNGGAGGAAFVNVSTDANVTIKDLTFSGATAIDQEDPNNAKAAIVADYVQGELTLNNVHVTNSTVKGIYCLGGLINDVQGGTANITNCSVTKTTFSNIEIANQSGCIGSIVGRVAGSATIDKTPASDNVIEAYVCRGNQERTVGDYVGNFTGADGRSLVITEGTISNVNITAKNTLAESQQNIYGEFLGGWRDEGKGTISINGTEVVRFINTQAEFEAAVKAGGIVFLSDNETGEPYTWVAPTKDVTIVGREGLATTRSARPAYATIKFGGGNLNAGASKIAFEKLNLKFTDTDYSGFHHSAEESYKQCNIYECVWTYAPKATFENCYFYQDNNDYNIWMYGANTNDITVKGCEFETDNKSILIYAEGARTYDVTVENCTFKAARATDKCAIQMHTERGNLSGTLVMNNNTATGYEATNGGLYKEWVNGAIAGGLPQGTITNYFDKTLNGVNLNQAVVNAIKAGGDVTLSVDLPVKETFDIPAGVTTNLDLNGKTIYIRPAADATAAVDINNNGTLNITGGKIVAKADAAEYARRCIYNRADGVMTINGTEFVQELPRGGAINNAGKMTIENATVTSEYWTIWNEGNGELTINGGTYTNNSYTEANDSKYCYAVKNTGDAKLTINGGTFNCTHGFVTPNGGEVTINGGVVNNVSTQNQSAHLFYVDGDAALTVPSTSTLKVNWNNVNGSSLMCNTAGDPAKLVIEGGLYNINNVCQGKILYFKASGNDEYPYQAISAVEYIDAALLSGPDCSYTLQENINLTGAHTHSDGSGASGYILLRGGVLDGDGHKMVMDTKANREAAISAWGGTLKNLEVSATRSNGSCVMNYGKSTSTTTAPHGDIVIDNCTLTGAHAIYVVVDSNEGGLKITNSNINGNVNALATVKFMEAENTVFDSYNGNKTITVRQNSTFAECEFKDVQIDINTAVEVTFENCTHNGVPITEENVDDIIAPKSNSNATINVVNGTIITNSDDLRTAIANANAGDEILVKGDFTGCFEIVNKTVTIKAAGEANFDGILWLDETESKFIDLTFANTQGVQKPNPTNSSHYNKINAQYPLVGCYQNVNASFENCVFNMDESVNLRGFRGYALCSPAFEDCTFNCNYVRPIDNSGSAITVNNCTFNNQYHYSVRLYENSETVTFTNNTITGTPGIDDKTGERKPDFEGVNFSTKGGVGTVISVKTNISGNTAPAQYGLKYRYHANASMVYADGSNFTDFEWEGTPTEVATTDALTSALASGKTHINLSAGVYTMPSGSSFSAGDVITCEEGTVFEGKSGLNINGATIVGATFNKESYENAVGAVSGTINGTLKECTFTGGNALRYCYAGETVVFEDCVFDGQVYGVHFDAGSNDVIFRNCTLSGFNAFGSAMNVTFENCTFKCTGKSAYNGVNLWGSAKMIGCEFTFDGAAANEWIWCNEEGGYTYEMTNCTIAGEQVTPANYTQFIPKIEESGATVKINGVDCVLTK